jgi:opacity protein-like surface antigen
MAEWSKENTRSILGANTGWYASSGYRFGKFTPYLTYAQVKLDSNKSDPGLTTASAAAASLNAALNSFLGSNAAQKTISAGVRWDFAKNIALKLQYDHIRLSSGSQGTLINTQPDFQRGGKVNLFTTVLDFVF